MKKLLSIAALAAALAGGARAGDTSAVVPRDYYGKIAERVALVLPHAHVLHQPFNDVVSQRAWTNLVAFYDFDHSVFLQSDLDRLAVHEFTLDDELKDGDTSFGYELYRLYCTRLKERIDFATNVLATAADELPTNGRYRVKRKDAPWPATREEAEEHWRRRLAYELRVQYVNRELDDEEAAVRQAARGAAAEEADEMAEGPDEVAEAETAEEADESVEAAEPPKDPVDNLIKKYRQYITVLTEPDEETVLQSYLSAVCRAYDPHTDYLSPASKEEFDMDMNLTLCGVGAVLSMDDGALKIAEVMPGGPMDVDGRIKEGDKIVGVQQDDGEMEDIMWQPMKKSIRKIRGKKGTRVTLEVVPRADTSGASRKRIELVRDEIKLEDQAATGRVERVTLDGVERKLGYVYLPGFYGTMDKQEGEEGYRSCADDVKAYLADFNAQDVEGLVLDLRGNGGGSLREAGRLSEAFVPGGPVVQIYETRGVYPLMIRLGNRVTFRKPVVVLTDRASASASEIVAGHLRDMGRAVVLGDVRTHGKGTVQTVAPVDRYHEEYGTVKITTARFYRVDGRSTQVKGVEADIHLPSLLDSLDIGEDKLENALPFTRIRKADFVKCWNLDTYLPALAARSEARLADDAAYRKHLANVAGMKAISDREEVPLAHDELKELLKGDRAFRELDEDDEDEESSAARRRRRNRRKKDDVVLDEAFRVLADLVQLSDGAELPPTRADWYNAIFGI
ncbi:MAG: carboxy terminal-processing peptidase [Kiritimatiellae bacterium]|nr:carboxy terminal-processing peptidase [Kiritimatiellia bacterium]